MSNEPQKSEPNNLEWLSKLTDECFYEENYAGARVHFELAITAKINEIEKQAYNKGYIDGGIYGITQLTENLTERG